MQKDNEEFVLVLGSKPNSKIPKIRENEKKLLITFEGFKIIKKKEIAP